MISKHIRKDSLVLTEMKNKNTIKTDLKCCWRCRSELPYVHSVVKIGQWLWKADYECLKWS